MQHGTGYLRITKSLTNGIKVPNTFQVGHEDEIEEDDEEALASKTRVGRTVVVYDIVHSPSYQVPVLYLSFKNLPSGPQPSIDELYQMLVPTTYRSSVQITGQLGAITLTEHPITGMPAYFVHPCRTREAMEPALEGMMVKPAEYIMLWLSTIGASVGLNVPLPLAAELDAMSQVREETLGRS